MLELLQDPACTIPRTDIVGGTRTVSTSAVAPLMPHNTLLPILYVSLGWLLSAVVKHCSSTTANLSEALAPRTCR